MEANDLKTLQKRVLRTKKDLRKWESVFEQKHGRPPTVKDISERPNIEKFYKKYNHLKKELKKETQLQGTLSAASSPSQNDTQPTSISPQRPQERRNSSVEFERSPSHPMSRMKSIFQSESSSLSVRRLSEIDQLKTALAASSSTSTVASQGTICSQGDRQLTEDEAFWLGVTPTSATPTPASSPPPTPSSQPRLILGGSQPNKKRTTKPVYRRRRQMLLTQSQPLPEQNEHPLTTTASSQPSHTVYNNELIEEDEDNDMEGIEIVNHEENPFRHYDPSLFHWDDPTFSVGPGFFSSKACTSFTIPILNEPSRRERVLKKLAKGTLGEVLAENQAMEEDLDEEMRQFIANNTIIDPNSLEAALTPIDENMMNTPEYTYKKRPLQKRQTKLFKLKFVETR